MNTYFVTVHGEIVATNLTKEQAVNQANKHYCDKIGMLSIGIGKIKTTPKGRFYTLLPMSFYL